MIVQSSRSIVRHLQCMPLLQHLNICVCYNTLYDQDRMNEDARKIDDLMFHELLVGKDKDRQKRIMRLKNKFIMERIDKKKNTEEEKDREKTKKKKEKRLDFLTLFKTQRIELEQYDNIPCLLDCEMGLWLNLKHLYLVAMRYTNIRNDDPCILEYKTDRDDKIFNRLNEIEKRMNKTDITSDCKIESIGCEIVATNVDKFSEYINLFLLNNFGNQIQSIHINYDTHIFDQEQLRKARRFAGDSNDQKEAKMKEEAAKENSYLSKWHFLKWNSNESNCNIEKSKKEKWFPYNLCELAIYNLRYRHFFNNLLNNVFIGSKNNDLKRFHRLEINKCKLCHVMDVLWYKNEHFIKLLSQLIGSNKLNCIIMNDIEIDMSYLIPDYFTFVEKNDCAGYYDSMADFLINDHNSPYCYPTNTNNTDFSKYSIIQFEQLTKRLMNQLLNDNNNVNNIERFVFKTHFRIPRKVPTETTHNNGKIILEFFNNDKNTLFAFITKIIESLKSVINHNSNKWKKTKLMFVYTFDFDYLIFNNATSYSANARRQLMQGKRQGGKLKDNNNNNINGDERKMEISTIKGLQDMIVKHFNNCIANDDMLRGEILFATVPDINGNSAKLDDPRNPTRNTIKIVIESKNNDIGYSHPKPMYSIANVFSH